MEMIKKMTLVIRRRRQKMDNVFRSSAPSAIRMYSMSTKKWSQLLQRCSRSHPKFLTIMQKQGTRTNPETTLTGRLEITVRDLTDFTFYKEKQT